MMASDELRDEIEHENAFSLNGWREAMEYAYALECVIVDHCEPGYRDLMIALVNRMRRKYAPTIEGELYDWRSNDSTD